FRTYNDKKTIDLKNSGNDIDTIKYLINVYYMQGVSQIELTSDSVIPIEIKNELKKLQLYLPGLEVENESFNYIRLKVKDNLNLDIIEEMKNFSLKLLTLLEDLEKVIAKPNKQMAIDLKNRSEDLNRVYNILIREIALVSQEEERFEQNKITSVRDLILYAIAMRDMGRMLSHIRTTSTILSICTNISHEYQNIVSQLILMFKDSLEVFFNQNLNYIKEIRDKMKEISKIADSLDGECKELGKELVRIGSYCVALMDDGVHKSVKL
ncbi:AbrB family transcriptional regulator, partial [Sulfolobus sp. F3]